MHSELADVAHGGPTVEVCIVAYRNRGTIAESVESAAVIGSNASIAVHDNCPTDPTVGVAEAAARRISVPFRAEPCEANCGFGAACNSLAASSRADVLLFINPDAQLQNWPYAGDVPMSSIEAPLIADPTGRLTKSWATAERTVADEVRARWLRRRAPRPAGVGTVSGAAMLVGRAMFTQLGGFDPRFFMYYEDIDLCGRAVRAGYPVRLRTDWHARHIGGYSAAGDVPATQLRSYQSARAYHAKWEHNVLAFDAVCLVDALARSILQPSTRDIPRGHRQLIREVWSSIRERIIPQAPN